MQVTALKEDVKEFWEHKVCGSQYGEQANNDRRKFFAEIDQERYLQEPMLQGFAQFEQAQGKTVLEIGLGTGADFSRWVKAGAKAFGRDLTSASVAMVKERLSLDNLTADVSVGDAENLADFPDDYFDIYYSWGVLHHTPNTEKAIAEAARVLKPGGTLKIMLYQYPSVGAYLVWLLHGPLRLKFISPRKVYADNVESPGTQMFSRREANEIVRKYFKPESIQINTYLGAGDLLTQKLSHRYQGLKWRLIQSLYPRWFIRGVLGDRYGTEMTIIATK